MFINSNYNFFVSDYRKQLGLHSTSMAKLSSGKSMLVPGENPADLGMSDRFRRQIAMSASAGRTSQNAINAFMSADSWMNEVHSMLSRMAEIATASADGSKTQGDREILNLEFTQLKSEIARISELGRYNGLQINATTAVAVWDSINKKINYMQPDGTDVRTTSLSLDLSATASDGTYYAFENSGTRNIGDYLFTENGKYLLYIAQVDRTGVSAQRTVMKLNVEQNTIEKVNLTANGGESAHVQARIIHDEQGRVWVSNPQTAAASAGGGLFQIIRLSDTAMSIDSGGAATTNKWAGQSTSVRLASGYSNFAAYDDYLYFFNRSGNTAGNKLNYVKQSIYDRKDITVLLGDMSGATTYSMGLGNNYTISDDGQYIAFEDSTGVIKVINAMTGKYSQTTVGSAAGSVTAIDFDGNNNLYWTDTTRHSIFRADIEKGTTPSVTDIRSIHKTVSGAVGTANNTTIAAMGMGLSVTANSPASKMLFQVGPNKNEDVRFVAIDARLYKLGIGQARIDTDAGALEALKNTERAVNRVAIQRAELGSQISRLQHIFSANSDFESNLSQAQSRIADVDHAKEASESAEAQVREQTALAMISQANSTRSSVLSLFQ